MGWCYATNIKDLKNFTIYSGNDTFHSKMVDISNMQRFIQVYPARIPQFPGPYIPKPVVGQS